MESKYFCSFENADFMEELLTKLGVKITKENRDKSVCFTLNGYGMRTHILIDDIFERVNEISRRK